MSSSATSATVPRGSLRCVRCGYDLADLRVDGRCPECGVSVLASAPRGRRPMPARVARVCGLWLALTVFYAVVAAWSLGTERGGLSAALVCPLHFIAGVMGIAEVSDYRQSPAWVAALGAGIALLLLTVGLRALEWNVVG